VATGHLRHVDGLRALAALFVVVHHAFLTIWPIDLRVSPQGVDELLTNWAAYGHFAVSVFIVISGYVLTLPYRDDEKAITVSRFYWRRVKRILPAYYASIAFALLLIWLYIGRKTGTHWDISIPITERGLAEHVAMVHHVFGNAEFNHVLWSIGVECQIYLLFPVLLWVWRRWGPLACLLLGTVVGYGLYYALRRTPYEGVTPQYLSLFCMGMMAAYAPRLKGMPWLLLSLLGVMIVVWQAHATAYYFIAQRFAFFDGIVGLATMCLLIGTYEGGRAKQFLSWGPLAGIGLFSYSLYLLHAPLLQVFWQLVPQTQERHWPSFLLLLAVSFPPILLLSYLSYRFIEKPCMSTRQRGTIESHAAP
jgi:peptidoglycan/LPS O-acetylase OafA/YrhL